jgi:hypothetical protein
LALIDTGASGTCIDTETATEMGLPVIGMAKMTSASHHEVDAPVYAIQIQIVGLPLALQVPRTLGAALKAQGLIALIGRDVIAAMRSQRAFSSTMASRVPSRSACNSGVLPVALPFLR